MIVLWFPSKNLCIFRHLFCMVLKNGKLLIGIMSYILVLCTTSGWYALLVCEETAGMLVWPSKYHADDPAQSYKKMIIEYIIHD